MSADGGLYRALGRLVRLHRERARLTQDELARRVGMTRTSITNIESGRQKIQIDTLYQVARTLEISPDALLPSPGEDLPEMFETQLSEELSAEEKNWAVRVLAKNERA